MREYYYVSDFRCIEDMKYILPSIQWISKMKNKRKLYYAKFPYTFDIETSTVDEKEVTFMDENDRREGKPVGFMYHWQFGFVNATYPYGECPFTVICGRRWEEFIGFMQLLKEHYKLNHNRMLVIYVHFLAYEFQHIRNFFEVTQCFARQERVPLKCILNDAFECRCSYILTNMPLAKAIKQVKGAKYQKLSGDDFDYKKLRTAITELTDLEIEYCLNDVRGLLEVVLDKLKDDDLFTIPMTSTGYLRREARDVVLANPANQENMRRLALSPKLYVMCKEAFRGGNSNSNPYLANQILEKTKAFDRKSSYPAEMVVSDFPISPFLSVRPSIESYRYYAEEHKAMLMQVTFFNIEMKDRMTIGYIPHSKCLQTEGDRRHGSLVIANGRVVKAVSLTMMLTDIDYKIIDDTYKFTPIFHEIYVADYGHLYDELRVLIRDTFLQKCLLESGDRYLYNKFKNKINAFFGMMVTDICAADIDYEDALGWCKEKTIDIAKKLKKYYGSRTSFLNYQQGVWVTARAREQHQLGIQACGVDIVMGDTDSCKFIGNHELDFKRLNQEWSIKCANNDISPTVYANDRSYTMGLWEQEETCSEYKTIGAKKHAYIYERSGEHGITVAGLNKEKGAKWLVENGGLEAFQIGKTIPVEYSGRTVSYYNDYIEPYFIEVAGCTMLTASNIATMETTYTIGVSDDYLWYLLGISLERISFTGDFYTEEEEQNILRQFGKEICYE